MDLMVCERRDRAEAGPTVDRPQWSAVSAALRLGVRGARPEGASISSPVANVRPPAIQSTSVEWRISTSAWRAGLDPGSLELLAVGVQSVLVGGGDQVHAGVDRRAPFAGWRPFAFASMSCAGSSVTVRCPPAIGHRQLRLRGRATVTQQHPHECERLLAR
jgi:hypothetical protein